MVMVDTVEVRNPVEPEEVQIAEEEVRNPVESEEVRIAEEEVRNPVESEEVRIVEEEVRNPVEPDEIRIAEEEVRNPEHEVRNTVENPVEPEEVQIAEEEVRNPVELEEVQIVEEEVRNPVEPDETRIAEKEVRNPEQEVRIPREFQMAAEIFDADYSNNETKIHKYPEIFKIRFIKDVRNYFVPSVVAIGPYHLEEPHLKEAEKVKRAAAYHFCYNSTGHQVATIKQKIRAIRDNVKSCYDQEVVADISMDDFVDMMFYDGCFLLMVVLWRNDRISTPSTLFHSWCNSNNASIMRDIFLLENQIPWSVLDALTAFRLVEVNDFISKAAASFQDHVYLVKSEVWKPKNKSPHLLGRLLSYQSGLWDTEDSTGKATYMPLKSINLCLQMGSSTNPLSRQNTSDENKALQPPKGVTSIPQSSSAIELAEIGIKLIARKKSLFKHTGIKIGCLFGELFLAPLVLDDQNACWLVNMVALEACSGQVNKRIVSSYVYLLAMLMNREEDVHELRVKRIVQGDFSDQSTLAFFKNLAGVMSITMQHRLLLADLEKYKRKRRIWILMHKFVYNHIKIIVTVLSVVGVLVGIFKALMSIKQHHQ